MVASRIRNPRYNTVTTNFSDAEFHALNLWIEKQNPKPNKAAALRSFVLNGLGLPKRVKTDV